MATISFARGVPPPELLPVEELADCARAAIERDGGTVLNYGPVGGLRAAARVGRRAPRRRPGRGAAHERLAAGPVAPRRALLARGARVLVEAPTYDRAAAHPRAASAPSRCPCRSDEEGLDVDALALELGRPPRSSTRSRPSRTRAAARSRSSAAARLAELAARRASLLIVEDDPYGARPLRGRAAAELFELAGGEGVVYSSPSRRSSRPASGSATSSSRPTCRRAGDARRQTYLTPALVSQATVFEFLRRGLLEPNLEHVARCSASGATRCSRRSSSELPDGASWSRPEGGYFVWLDLPRARRGALLGARRAARASRSSRAPTSSRPARAGAAQLGLPTALSRPPTSARESRDLPDFCASCARRRWRYSCESSMPPTSPIASSSSIVQISRTFAVEKTKSIRIWSVFWTTNATAYADRRPAAPRSSRRGAAARSTGGLPLRRRGGGGGAGGRGCRRGRRRDGARRVRGARGLGRAHAAILRRGGFTRECAHRARHEPRLLRRLQEPAVGVAEGGAGRLEEERAET